MKTTLKTTAYACLLFLLAACASPSPTPPTPANEVAGTYSVSTFTLNNRAVAITKGSMTIAESGERIRISELNVNGTTYPVAAELNVAKETNGSISIGDGYGVYQDRILNLKFSVVSGGVQDTYIIKASKQ
ncbi:MAG: hypothetical protein U0X91_30700 [Spirosomataceae bacterium]